MSIFRYVLWIVLVVAISTPHTLSAQQVTSEGATLAAKVAPGERVPLSVRLSNFGSNNRVDVTVTYTIINSTDDVITEVTETVAVETTSSYVKHLPLPADIASGQYIARVSITYDDQLVPATATYQFTVESKVLGIFWSAFILYGVIFIAACLLVVLLFVLLGRKARAVPAQLFDYSHVPRAERVYYEIISDTIRQMRLHKGNQAIDVATTIPGLTVERATGRVVRITGDPSDTIAQLVDAYEHQLGKRVNLSLGEGDTRAIVR